MTDAPSPLEQVAAAQAPPPVAAPTSVGGLSPDITAQFMQQMRDDRDQGAAALAQRKSALEQYQDAIKSAPSARTSADAFNAIGEGFYANPNFAWNPSAALASGFARMNQVSDLRRQQAQEAPVEAAKVGYENYKDLSDKIGTKDMLTPAAMISSLNQGMRTTGSEYRQMLAQRDGVRKMAYDAAIKANKADPAAIADAEADKWFRAQVANNPDFASARNFAGIPSPTGPTSVPPPPNPLDKLPAPMRARIEADMAANPAKAGAKTSVAMFPGQGDGAPAVQGAIPAPPPGWQPGQSTTAVPVPGAAPKVTDSSPGLTVEQEAARKAAIKGAEVEAGTANKELPEAGAKYLLDVTHGESDALAMKRNLNELDTHLSKLSEMKKNGNLAGANKFIGAWKVAFDPDGSGGISTPEDREMVAHLQGAEKLNYQLAIQSSKLLSSRATQMEFLKGMQNMPNANMTTEARQEVMRPLKEAVEDTIGQSRDLSRWAKENGIDLTHPKPGEAARYLEHMREYNGYQNERLNGRDIANRHPELTMPFVGKDGKTTQITVRPRWSNEYKGLVVTTPAGVQRLNAKMLED